MNVCSDVNPLPKTAGRYAMPAGQGDMGDLQNIQQRNARQVEVGRQQENGSLSVQGKRSLKSGGVEPTRCKNSEPCNPRNNLPSPCDAPLKRGETGRQKIIGFYRPHKHAEVIRAWAEGVPIQYFLPLTGVWRDLLGPESGQAPRWLENAQYRITPGFISKTDAEIEALKTEIACMKNMQEEMDFLRSLSQELIQEKVNLLTLVNEISECLEAVDGRLAETVSEIIEASLNSAQANASLASYRTGHLISQF